MYAILLHCQESVSAQVSTSQQFGPDTFLAVVNVLVDNSRSPGGERATGQDSL
jgi:hypothetical protein